MLLTAAYASPIGLMTMAEAEGALVGLWIDGQKHAFGAWRGTPMREEDTDLFRRVSAWLDAYFAGQRPEINALPLSPRGTALQQEVWGMLREIPYGQTTTYGALAKRIAARREQTHFSAQAVGQAIGRNPVMILIPCHRVLGAQGDLTGYAGGIERKRALLRLEGVALPLSSCQKENRR